MAVSRKPEYRQSSRFWKRMFGQVTRYDLVLTAIPVLFAMAFVAHLVLAVPFHAAVAVGGVLSGILLVDVLYYNPPVGGKGA